MSAELAVVQPTQAPPDLTAIERVIVAGDLKELTPDERWNYYRGVCQSVGLNPFTQPFLYITLSGKLVLYATKGAADQLRDNHHISIGKPTVDLSDGLCIVAVTATDRTGRTDSDLGIVPIENLRGDAKANAILKAVTKAKRRVTLSMCGLGMLDETEVETIPAARFEDADSLHGKVEPTTEDVNRAEHMTGASLERPKAPLDIITEAEVAGETLSRVMLDRWYNRLAAIATDREHKHAAKINSKKPVDLDYEPMVASLKVLLGYFPDVTVALLDADDALAF